MAAPARLNLETAPITPPEAMVAVFEAACAYPAPVLTVSLKLLKFLHVLKLS